ncbi:BON domain-containing protein [Terriglobus saanensis]|uniref:Transport-associated protein n=1 Tax=Terriglobus saanensis (strain ATCC BAA-1853 / DSM 23119 / SP1PR4) TaxID=401053 RepID=E8V5V6_TERSS|nr:BON domain-containing protein [Terriglobus saanensis]ADV83774.1 transport-associated protein [Terriglobus saanensis SP1PR4]
MNRINATRNIGAVATLALALIATGCKPKPVTVDDPTLMSNIQQKIASDGALHNEAIQVYVQQGAATLNGQVSSEAARSLAANDAAAVAGVAKVINNLVVGPTPTTTATVTAPPPVAPEPVAPKVKHEKVVREPAPVQRYTPPPPPQPLPEQARVVAAPPPPPPPPRAPAGPVYRTITLASGSTLPVRVTTPLDSATTQTGDAFSGVIASDVIQDGMVVLAHGTPVTGRVTEAKDAGHFSGNSELAVELTGLNRHGERIALTTEPYDVKGKGRGANTATKAGVGAAAGAILGGIFGGGKGAAIGAAAGGGTGAGINAVTRGQQVQIPSESIVRFHLANSIAIRTATAADSSTPGDPSLQTH